MRFSTETDTLAVGTTLTAFLANPKPFIDGTTHLAGTVGDAVVKPVVQGTVQAVSWLLLPLLVLVVGIPGAGVYLAVKHPKEAGEVAKLATGLLPRK